MNYFELTEMIHATAREGFTALQVRQELIEYLHELQSRIQKLESRLESEDDIKIGGTD